LRGKKKLTFPCSTKPLSENKREDLLFGPVNEFGSRPTRYLIEKKNDNKKSANLDNPE
jgi:hypothetical protein